MKSFAWVALLLPWASEAAEAEFLRFPVGFRWCVATAAHQIEGANTLSDWWAWEHLPPVCDSSGSCKCKVARCETSGAATDHWNRVSEDIELMKGLGVGAYRFSLEWAKLEPRRGEIDEAVVEHYRLEVEALRRAGIEPFITLQHFTMPNWLRELGGWEWSGAPEAFGRFAELSYRRIAPGVRDWVTINEPLVHLGGGYVLGWTPPGLGGGGPEIRADQMGGQSSRKARVQTCGDLGHGYIGARAPTADDLRRVIAPARGMLLAHAAAYRALHREAERRALLVRVGMAHHLRVFDPRSAWNPLDRWMAGLLDRLWNWTVIDALRTGELRVSIPTLIRHREEIPGLAGTQDFLGINYYTRDRVWFKWDRGPSVGIGLTEGAPTNDLAWEIYPRGLYRVIREAARRGPGLPVLITENGVADCDDSRRADFLREHLRWLHRAIGDGIEIESYCHWSLLDNFEWIEGFAPRFGLFEVDYWTQKRTPRPSAELFSRIARENGLR